MAVLSRNSTIATPLQLVILIPGARDAIQASAGVVEGHGVHLDDLIIDVGVEDTRYEPSPNALDLVWTRRAPRQDWALAWLHRHHMHWLL